MAYKALSTANLPDPVIDPAQGSSPEDYFNVIAYPGSGSQSVTGVGFQPDLVWVKGRTTAYNHQLHDVVRGATAGALFSNSTVVEQTAYQFDSFDSDGFTTDSANVTGINNTGQTFVAWNWKANGSGVSNTDGSITSTVSANITSGLSVVTFVGNGTAGTTVGHGLGVVPETIIIKGRDDAFDWRYWHTDFGTGRGLSLNSTAARSGNSEIMNAVPTSLVMNLQGQGYSVNNSAIGYVAYCFHSVEGFSKFGSYTGNGSADGVFVYTGFRPAFVMVKATSTANDWFMYDTKRNTYNVVDNILVANGSNSESGVALAARNMDILSNGFKCRGNDGGNLSGQTHIYMAFAEQPFKFSNAR
jgi:hypothetical protein